MVVSVPSGYGIIKLAYGDGVYPTKFTYLPRVYLVNATADGETFKMELSFEGLDLSFYSYGTLQLTYEALDSNKTQVSTVHQCTPVCVSKSGAFLIWTFVFVAISCIGIAAVKIGEYIDTRQLRQSRYYNHGGGD